MKGLYLAVAAALAAVPLAAQPAAAQTGAVVMVDLNLRTGPDLSYPPVGVMPAGTPVTVFGCTEGYMWCDVAWGYNRGWVAGQYLAAQGPQPNPFSVYGPRFGIPIVSFVLGDYWDRYYRGRPWYAERDRWNYWDYRGRRWREGYDEKKWESQPGAWDPKRGEWTGKRGDYRKRGAYEPKYDPKRYDPKRGEDPKRGTDDRKRNDPKAADPKKGGDPKKDGDPKSGDKGDPKKG